jgi:hypothetical protein
MNGHRVKRRDDVLIDPFLIHRTDLTEVLFVN